MVVRQGRTITIDDEDDANDRVDEKMTASLLDMGHLLLSAATNILTDIAFIKLKILQDSEINVGNYDGLIYPLLLNLLGILNFYKGWVMRNCNISLC